MGMFTENESYYSEWKEACEMTKKHFKALAERLKQNEPEKFEGVGLGVTASYMQWRRDCQAVADVCSSANILFDHDRFLEACGLKGI